MVTPADLHPTLETLLPSGCPYRQHFLHRPRHRTRGPPDIATPLKARLDLLKAYVAELTTAYGNILQENKSLYKRFETQADTISHQKAYITALEAKSSPEEPHLLTDEDLMYVARHIAPLPGYSKQAWIDKPRPYNDDVRCWFIDFEQVMRDVFNTASPHTLRKWAIWFLPRQYLRADGLAIPPMTA